MKRKTHLPHIQRYPPLRRPSARVRHRLVQPRILLARRLKQDVHVRREPTLKHGNRRVVGRLQRVHGVGAEDALGIGQAPV